MEVSSIKWLFDYGIVSGLFVFIMIMIVIKGIPFMLKQATDTLKNIEENHKEELKMLREKNDEIINKYNELLSKQQEQFLSQIADISKRNENVLSELTNSIRETTKTFLKKIEDSDKWHERHSNKLEKVYGEVIEVKNLLHKQL